MPSLPDRPDLGQLRRLAKELRDAANRAEADALTRVTRQVGGNTVRPPITLAIAQLTLAREHGFASWPTLKAAVEAGPRPQPQTLDEFLTASIEGEQQLAQQLLRDSPALAAEPLAAVVLGDAQEVATVIAGNPTWTRALDERRGWPPLMYVCYSQWHHFEPKRAQGLLATALLLLDAGAQAGTHNSMPDGKFRSALHGSATTDQGALTRLLLQRGASVHDGATLRDAASNGSYSSLVALLDHGATIRRTWAVGAAAYGGHTHCLRALLEALTAKEGPQKAANEADDALEGLGPGASAEVVRALLDFGADPNGPGHERPPAQAAVRSGRPDIAELLVEAGATTTISPVDELIGACARGDRAEVERRVLHHPGLIGQFTDDDRAAIVELAGSVSSEPVRLLLDIGVPVTARNQSGETALHYAAHQGRTATVALLLERGAELEAVDHHFSATPLAYATVGSGERPNADGDWPGTVRALLRAGANPAGVWVEDKPPSPAVGDLLEAFGAPPPAPPPTQLSPAPPPTQLSPAPPPAESAAPGGVEQPPLGDLDRLSGDLREAYVRADMELFASVLHPDVVFGDGPMACVGREEVIAQFATMVERGLHGEITRFEARPGVLVAEVRFSGTPQDMAPPSPQLAYQRFDAENGQVVRITGHKDIATALAHRAISPNPK